MWCNYTKTTRVKCLHTQLPTVLLALSLHSSECLIETQFPLLEILLLPANLRWLFIIALRIPTAHDFRGISPRKWARALTKRQGPGKRGHIVADTLLLMMFLVLRKLGNICCGHKMLLNKIRNIFFVPDTNLCPQQMLPARVNGETFLSATMCQQQCVHVCQGLKRFLSN